VRNPVRTEGEAFSWVLAAVAVFGTIVVGALLGGGDVALGMAVALVVGAAVGIYLSREPKEREPAVWERGDRASGDGS
jgi:hypothetical protein